MRVPRDNTPVFFFIVCALRGFVDVSFLALGPFVRRNYAATIYVAMSIQQKFNIVKQTKKNIKHGQTKKMLVQKDATFDNSTISDPTREAIRSKHAAVCVPRMVATRPVNLIQRHAACARARDRDSAMGIPCWYAFFLSLLVDSLLFSLGFVAPISYPVLISSQSYV